MKLFILSITKSDFLLDEEVFLPLLDFAVALLDFGFAPELDFAVALLDFGLTLELDFAAALLVAVHLAVSKLVMRRRCVTSRKDT